MFFFYWLIQLIALQSAIEEEVEQQAQAPPRAWRELQQHREIFGSCMG